MPSYTVTINLTEEQASLVFDLLIHHETSEQELLSSCAVSGLIHAYQNMQAELYEGDEPLESKPVQPSLRLVSKVSDINSFFDDEIPF